MSNRYPIPDQQHRVEEEIQRSRFITTLAPAETVDEAQAFINRMREEFPDATHNCWAYLVGPPGSSSKIGMSDDGEPHGTAGRPMLNVLSHAEVGDVAAVVTRYYGGSKLGKGGLARAYGGGVQEALNSLPTRQKIAYAHRRLTIGYPHVTVLQRMFDEFGVEKDGEDFSAEVVYTLRIPEENLDGFTEAVTSLTAGQAGLQKL